jgi:nucleoside-diphosphate-sugar epimerase
MTDARPVRTILLTGGAGVLGQSLVEALARDYRLVCLVRRSTIAHPAIELLKGDITQPDFGLGTDEFARLASRIDWIVHSAAITRLEGHDDEIHRANFVGTRNVLALARLAGCPLYHISTAFTHDCDYFEGVMPPTAYEIAKREAAPLIRDSDVRTSVFRPSIIIGDSRTGRMPSFQGFHMTVGLVASGVLPIVPSPAEARVDVIARDVAALAIKAALDRRMVGGDHFLTSGDAAPTIADLVDVIGEVVRGGGKPFARPRCMHPDVFDRLLKPVFLPTVNGELRAVLLRAAAMCRYVCLRSPLPGGIEELLPSALDRGRPLDALRHSVEFMRPKLGAFSRMALGGSAPARKRDDEPEFA